MSQPTAKALQSIIDESTQVHFERLQCMRMLVICLLARKHPFLLGPPGTNKSRIIRWLFEAITGAGLQGEDPVYWEQLFNNQLGLEDIAGPIDMVAYDKQGVWHRKPDGYLPTAHVGFADEVFKANGSVRNPMLAMMNEFVAHLNSKPVSIPLLMLAMASNEMPEDQESGAFWDRRGGGMVLDYIQEDGNFDKLLQLGAGDIVQSAQSRTTVSLADLQTAVFVDVPAIVVPSNMRDAIRNLKDACEHPTDGLPAIKVSDRRWFQTLSLLKASAYLAGRSNVDDDDLQVLRWFLWETPEMIPAVEKRVVSLASPQTAKALEIAEAVDEWASKVAAIKGQSAQAKAELGAEVNGKIKKFFAELTALKQDAMASGRSAQKIEDVEAQVSHLRKTVLIECLNVPREAADKL